MTDVLDVLDGMSTPVTFNNLVTLLKAVGLEYPLQREGGQPVTIFAPSDEAFNALPKGAVYDMLKNVDVLKSLLQYHIVPLKLTLADLTKLLPEYSGQSSTPSVGRSNAEKILMLPTLDSNHVLDVNLTNGFVVEDVLVLQPDVAADNGVIHVVQSILWPAGISIESFGARSPLNEAPTTGNNQDQVSERPIVSNDPNQARQAPVTYGQQHPASGDQKQ